ncbi:hypothetical protein CUMW_194940 [Citrus unshiu]|uniref:Uncharacterized protein n=1 Tax=Citrus sinensis TaxID=2711 RepID=A0A067GF63_CITSI|nr:hypothetical protein CISIN_1g040282mg [Citrus sinensis]GAY59504.1 hypothetical protein CUMW_194940 [Citrus unshiu]
MCAVLVTSFIMRVAYSEVFSDHSFYVYYSIIACSSFLILLNLQGHFFRQKASEADRKSAEKLVKTRNNEVMTLDWHSIEPKEVVCLLRVHLTSLSGIPTIKHLRIVVGTSDEDSKKEAQKRMIKKLLKKESIEWTEDGNGQAILIQVDVIDPKRLSFFRKK